MRLGAGFVRTVKTPGRFGDGRGMHGLALLVRPRAGGGVRKSWIQRIRINGRLTNLGLGPYPVVTLSEARKKALHNRRLVEQGRDPRGGEVPTFAEAAERVIQMHRAGWKAGSKTEHRWRSTLEIYAFPTLRAKPVDRITTGDIMNLLTPIWHDKNPTAQTLKREIATIMRWAIAQGHRSDNPAGQVVIAALPRHSGRTQHLRALPHSQVAAALNKVRRSDAHPTSVLLLEFQVLTAVRPTEARLAEWSEIDLDTATWTIAKHRTKKSRQHNVPLSARAVEVLNEARKYATSNGLVFVTPRGKHIAKNSVGILLRQMRVDCVPHGFRTSFRMWVEECTDTRRSVAEAALAHQNPDKTEAAYQRSDLFDKRRKLMDAWAAYLHQGPTPLP